MPTAMQAVANVRLSSASLINTVSLPAKGHPSAQISHLQPLKKLVE